VLHFDVPAFLGSILAAAPQAGDVLLAVGLPPQVQVDGELVRLNLPGLERFTPFQTEALVLHLLAQASPAAVARVRQEGAAHFAYSVPGVSRFRVAVFSQRGTFAICLRRIPEKVPAIGDLRLPEAMRAACRERNGIVVVSGQSGSGRTTSLAAMLAELNAARSCHVVTVEDPIEFLHKHARATVNQREVGMDTPTVAHGLASGLRQGAQVFLVAEPHDALEARLILEVAETGHLVLTSLRGYDTATSLLRLLSLFPADERVEVRGRLSRVLRWVFTQQLLPHRDGRRPVVEVWRSTRATAAHLAEGQLASAVLADILRDGEGDGQAWFDSELERRVRAGEIDAETAVANAVLPGQLELRIRDLIGGQS
jgi:twitching motility protein PilT